MDENKYLGSPCKRRHSGLRYKKGGVCVECAAASSKNFNWIGYRREDNNTRYRTDKLFRARNLFNAAQLRAREREIPIDITPEWILQKLETGVCELSGLPLDLDSKGGRKPSSPTLDKIRAAGGYTKDNTRVVCWALNAAFGNWGAEAFEPIAQAWLSRKLQVQ